MTIEVLPETICKDCGNSFRYNPRSTIKPVRCPKCQNLKDFQAKKENNKKMLSRSTLYDKNKRTPVGIDKYIIKEKSGKKRLKTPRERFYSSPAWKWFSRYILLYYSLNGEVVRCSTCGKFMMVNSKTCHVGHFIKVFDGNSTNFSVALEFTNVGPQCQRDNTFMGGRQDVMIKWLEEEHGKDAIDNLYDLKRQPFTLDDYTLDKIAEEYKRKFYNLLDERGWKNPWSK